MRFGVNMLLWTTQVTREDKERLAFVKQCGFDGVELPLFDGEVAHYREVGSMLDDLGLQRTCSAGLAPEHDPIHEDAAVRPTIVKVDATAPWTRRGSLPRSM